MAEDDNEPRWSNGFPSNSAAWDYETAQEQKQWDDERDQRIRERCRSMGLNADHPGVDWDGLRSAHDYWRNRPLPDDHPGVGFSVYRTLPEVVSSAFWREHFGEEPVRATVCPEDHKVRWFVLPDDPVFTGNLARGYPQDVDRIGGSRHYHWFLVARRCGCPENYPGSAQEAAAMPLAKLTRATVVAKHDETLRMVGLALVSVFGLGLAFWFIVRLSERAEALEYYEPVRTPIDPGCFVCGVPLAIGIVLLYTTSKKR